MSINDDKKNPKTSPPTRKHKIFRFARAAFFIGITVYVLIRASQIANGDDGEGSQDGFIFFIIGIFWAIGEVVQALIIAPCQYLRYLYNL